MKPGIYEDLSFDDYLAIDAVSNTRLGQLAKSPLHYKTDAGLDVKAKHLVLGSLIHAGRLEPLSIAERYAVMPAFELDDENRTKGGEKSTSKSTGYYKDKVAQFSEVNHDKEVVPVRWFQEMKAVVGSLCACTDAHRLLTGPGQVEVTLVWEDPDTGLLCKARMDRACPDRGAFVDLKTTIDLLKFPKAIAAYGYHRQMAHYQAGWAVLNDGELLTPWIIAAEKMEPYCVQSAPICEEALTAGYRERSNLLNQLRDCLVMDFWPGPKSPSAWRIPEWALVDNDPISLTVDGKELVL